MKVVTLTACGKKQHAFLAYNGISCMIVSVTVHSKTHTKRREPHRPKFGSLPIYQPDLWKAPPYPCPAPQPPGTLFLLFLLRQILVSILHLVQGHIFPSHAHLLYKLSDFNFKICPPIISPSLSFAGFPSGIMEHMDAAILISLLPSPRNGSFPEGVPRPQQSRLRTNPVSAYWMLFSSHASGRLPRGPG